MKKISSLLAITAVSFTFAAAGCKKKAAEENKDPAMKPEDKGSGDMKKDDGSAAAATGSGDMKKEEPPKTAGGGGDFPAECNDYKAAVDKLMACDKAKAAAGPMKEAFDNMWKQMEAAPAEARAAMGAGCKTAAESIATTMKSMGC